MEATNPYEQLTEDLKTEDPLQILLCARSNMGNIEDRLPLIRENISWCIGIAQLNAVIKNLEARNA